MLSTIDVAENPNLIELTCSNGQLNSLDVSKNNNLEILVCSNSKLTSLDVSQNHKLRELICFNNQLSTLDISQNNHIERLNCYQNQLISLNIKNGNNSGIKQFLVTDNPKLFCIQVDNVDSANSYNCITNSWCKDAIALYNENCAYSIEEYNNYEVKLYINQKSNNLYIFHQEPVLSTKIYSITGKIIKEDISSDNIDISQLVKGIYFIQIEINKKRVISKFTVD